MWILLLAAPSSSSSSSTTTELYLQNSHQDKNKSKDFQTKIELKMLRSDSRLIASESKRCEIHPFCKRFNCSTDFLSPSLSLSTLFPFLHGLSLN
jgi:hypothetical protein